MADAEHSLFSASKAAQWMACPGSLVLSKGAPRRTSRYAAEGTAAHTLAAWCLTERKQALAYLGRVIEADGFEFTVDDDMARDVQVYVDQVLEYANGADAVWVEQRVVYAAVIGADPDKAFGTSDAIILKGNLLIVDDLKFGRGEEVEPQDNPQLQLYALGALEFLEDLGEADGIERVLMVIHQPRVDSRPKEWEISVAELRAFATTAAVAVERYLDAMLEYPAPEWHERFTQATEKGCRWCPAKAGCVTARALVTETVFDTVPATPEEFAAVEPMRAVGPVDEDERRQWIAAALAKVDFIENWCTRIRAEAETELLAGKDVPGYKLVTGKRGPRQWADAKAAEEQLKAMRLKVEEMYDLKVISPTTAEKLAKDKVIGPRQWPKLQSLITQSEGKLHVAPMSDKREAITVTPVENEFAPVAPATSVDDLA